MDKQSMVIRMIRLCRRLFLAGVISLLLCEMIVRIWGYSDIYIYDAIYQPYNPAGEIEYIIKPNLKNALAPSKTLFNTNEIGLRSVKSGETIPSKPRGEFRIVLLGDSVTFGQGAPTEDIFSVVLEKELDVHGTGRIKTYNYGVMAYSIIEMVSTLEYRAMQIQPDLVLLCVIYDDFNLNRRCRLDKWGYLSGTLKESRLTDSILKKWLRDLHLTYFIRDLVSEPTTHHAPLIKEFPDVYAGLLEKFDRLIKGSAARALVVLLPDTHPYNLKGLGMLADLLRRKNIDLLDLTLLIREFSSDRFTCFPNDPHPSAEVHRRIGKEIAGYLRQSGAVMEPDDFHPTR